MTATTGCRSAAIIRKPGDKYAEEFRFWQGCPTILLTPGGTLYAGCYTGGTREPSPHNCNLLIRSRDGGKTWSRVVLAVASVPELQIRDIDIQLWLDPQKRAWVFWTQRDDRFLDKDPRHLSIWVMISADPDAEEPEWSEPRCITSGFLRCQPTVLADGRILLFSYDWIDDRYTYSESRDQGATWERRRGGRRVPTPFDEAMAVERRDGSIWMLARSDGGALAESISRDGGKTWSDGKLTGLRAPSSRFFLGRLRSGRLLLVKNDSLPPRRNHLTAYLSDNDGATWPWRMPIDVYDVSYPDAVESENGDIFLIYDYGRCVQKEILLARFTENDIMAGTLVDQDSFLRRLVSKAPEQPGNQAMYDRLKREDEIWMKDYLKRNDIKS